MTIPAQLAPAAYLQKPTPITPAWCLLIHGKEEREDGLGACRTLVTDTIYNGQ